MSHEVEWNKKLYDEFVNNACLTELERQVIDMHVNKDMTIVAMSMKLHVSEVTIKRAIRSLKDKYDSVQKHSDILPPRELKGIEKRKKSVG